MAEVEPVSSSAQLVLLPWLLGWERPGDRTALGAGLHAGSCVGIAWALRDDLRRLTARDVALLTAGSVPAAVTGALAADAVERRLGRPPQLAALLAGAGALMWWVDARATASERPAPVTARSDRTPALAAPRRRPADPTPAHPTPAHPTPAHQTPACPTPSGSHRGWRTDTVDPWPTMLAALAQVAALVPGVSRLGATMTALRAAGVDRAAARRHSLLMSLPITAGAAALSLARADRAALRELGPGLAAGMLVAALAGGAAATADRARPGRPLAAAALYRLGLAAVVAHRLHREGDP